MPSCHFSASSTTTKDIHSKKALRKRTSQSLSQLNLLDSSQSVEATKLPKLSASTRYPPLPDGGAAKHTASATRGQPGRDEAEEEVPLNVQDDSEAEMGRRFSGPLDSSSSHKRSHREAIKSFVRRRPVVVVFVALTVCVLLWTSSSSSSLTSSVTRTSHNKGPLPQGNAFEDVQQQGQPVPVAGSSDKCTPMPGRPDHQYALMIDAGSTGSRIHIYEFAFCQTDNANLDPDATPLPTLKDERFHQLRPGLSSFKGMPQAAAESLRPLLEEAMKVIPENERSCTPIALKATAGLRLLGAQDSQDILDAVRVWLDTEWPFSVVQQDGVVIMDGKDEGVYAWITINYLLGAIGPTAKPGASAAVMDLGGASTQIVFEPLFTRSDETIQPGDHVYDLFLPSGSHTLYQHSHLGYGLMQFRRSVHNLIAFTYVWQAAPQGRTVEWDKLTAQHEIPHPCMVKGGKKVVELDPPGRKSVEVTFVGTGAGFDACKRVVDVVMAKDALCEVEPCAFGGVYQPNLMETFESGPIYALSYFYDRIIPLGLGAGSESFTIHELRRLTQDVCNGPGSRKGGKSAGTASGHGWDRFHGSSQAIEELEDRPEYCLDLTFMHSLLTLGYELQEGREVRTGKQIEGIELGWTLGAAIAMLGGHLECSA